MIRHRSLIGLGLVLFLALDALGLMFLSSPPTVYSALAPTATLRRQPTRPPSPTSTPRRQTRSVAPQSNEWHVCTGVGGNFTKIQDAVDVAAPGDVIKVASGVYTEIKVIGVFTNNLYISKTVNIFGGYSGLCNDWTTQNYTANVTTIRPSNAAISVVSIAGQGGNPSAVTPTLDGFTITGGRSDLGFNHGGGIRMNNSNAVISNNIITGNIGYLFGGGIFVQRGAPVIQNNRIQNNLVTSGGYGGGVALEDTPATLTGNIITSNTITDTGGYGGGIATENFAGSTPITLTSNIILSNTAAITGTGFGGGVYLTYVAATLTSNTIQGSTASANFGVGSANGFGGGVYLANGTANLNGNVIQGNIASASSLVGLSGIGRGGGIYLDNVTATLASNMIEGNYATTQSLGYGGGLFITNSQTLTLTGNTFAHNSAGFGDSSSGGGAFFGTSKGFLSNNFFITNTASQPLLTGFGGGLAAYSSTLTVQGGQFSGNYLLTDGGRGGGLYSTFSQVTLDAVRVQNNSIPSNSNGGGMAFDSSPYTLTNLIVAGNGGFVGGIFAGQNSPGLVVNSDIIANDPYNFSPGISTASALTVTNSIIMSHTTGISLTAAVSVNVTFNDFYSNTTNQKGFSLDPSNIVVNPNLDATFHLNSGSPAIDAGTHTNAPDHDIDGEPRPMIGTSGLFKVDIGADEFTGTAQTNRRLATQPADFTLIGPGNPTEFISSTGSNDWIGYGVWGGDISGDNRGDLIVAAPNFSDNFDGGVNDTGRVFAVYNNGTRRVGVMDLYTTTANLEVRSYLNQQHIGQSFATADLNGGGARDLIIGAPGSANFVVTGTVFAFQGGAGLSGTKTLSPTMQATWRFRSGENTGTFGGKNSLATGKLNNDSIDDLVVAEGGATGPGNRTQAGAVFVFFGSSSLPTLWDMKAVSASLTIYGPATNSQLSRVAVGDVNGDGKLDLIVRSATTAYVFYGPLPSGVIDLATTPADATIIGLDGDWLALGDVDGDGKADIILGRSNKVDVVRGGTLFALQSIDAVAWARFTGVAPTTLYSFDWNGDGKSDVMIGDWNNNRAFVVFGGASLPNPADIFDSANWVITGENINDQFGYSFGGADLDADGALDLIIGSRSHVVTNHPLHFDDAGAVYVFYGTGTGALNQKIYLPLIMK